MCDCTLTENAAKLMAAEQGCIRRARDVVAEMEKIQSWGCDELTKKLYDLRQAVYTVNKAAQINLYGRETGVPITAKGW